MKIPLDEIVSAYRVAPVLALGFLTSAIVTLICMCLDSEFGRIAIIAMGLFAALLLRLSPSIIEVANELAKARRYRSADLEPIVRGNRAMEAIIIVEGVELTEAQSQAVRVALNSFVADLRANGIGEDEMGKRLAAGYVENTEAVLSLVHQKR